VLACLQAVRQAGACLPTLGPASLPNPCFKTPQRGLVAQAGPVAAAPEEGPGSELLQAAMASLPSLSLPLRRRAMSRALALKAGLCCTPVPLAAAQTAAAQGATLRQAGDCRRSAARRSEGTRSRRA